VSDQVSHFCKTRDKITVLYIVELHLSGRRLSGSPIIWICQVLRVNISRTVQNNLPWNYRLSYQA
jgi:hypothetical protein